MDWVPYGSDVSEEARGLYGRQAGHLRREEVEELLERLGNEGRVRRVELDDGDDDEEAVLEAALYEGRQRGRREQGADRELERRGERDGRERGRAVCARGEVGEGPGEAAEGGEPPLRRDTRESVPRAAGSELLQRCLRAGVRLSFFRQPLWEGVGAWTTGSRRTLRKSSSGAKSDMAPYTRTRLTLPLRAHLDATEAGSLRTREKSATGRSW